MDLSVNSTGRTTVEVGGIGPRFPHHIIKLIVRNVPLVKTTHKIRFRHDGWRLDEYTVPAFADTPGRWLANPKRLAVHAVSDKASFLGTTAQLLRACFNVYERPRPRLYAQKQCRGIIVLHAVCSVGSIAARKPTTYVRRVLFQCKARPRCSTKAQPNLPQVAKLRCCGAGVANSGHVLQAHESDELMFTTRLSVLTFGCSRDAYRPI